MLLNKLEKKINYKFKDITLLEEALTHSSYSKNNLKIKKKNYERLEFLGDRVLGLVISEFFFKKFPDVNEGILDNYFQKNANQDNLFRYAQSINLSIYLKTQKGDNLIQNKSILSDAIEAIIGAMYMDSGLNHCKNFIIDKLINKNLISSGSLKHPKSILQEYSLEKFKTLPRYSILNKFGNEHEPTYEVSVSIDKHKKISATGTSLKNAEEAAARKLLSILEI